MNNAAVRERLIRDELASLIGLYTKGAQDSRMLAYEDVDENTTRLGSGLPLSDHQSPSEEASISSPQNVIACGHAIQQGIASTRLIDAPRDGPLRARENTDGL